MAEPTKGPQDALRKITDQLECSICLNEYEDPKLLSCSHTFCKQCLERLVLHEHEQSILHCPNCRHTTVVPPQGVEGLQSDFRIHQLFEIRDALTIAKEPKKEQVIPCQLHPKNLLKIYCETCNELICNDCTIRIHKGHQHNLISETFPKHKQEIIDQLEPVKQHLATVNQALHNFNTRSKEIQDQRTAIQADIHKEIDQLHQALEQKRTELIGQLDHLTRHKLKSLAAQRDKVERTHTQLSSCLEYVEGTLKTGSPEQILEKKAPVLKQVQRITTEFNPDILTPKEEANMLLVPVDIPGLNKACGKVVEECDKFYISINEMETTTVGEVTTLTLHAIDEHANMCQEVTNISSELVSCMDARTVKCQVRRDQDNKYKIQYQPATRGKHQLHIRINGRSIKGSPYTVVARPSLQSLGKPVRTIGKLKKPWGITADSKGRIITTESGSNCITILTQQGHKIQSLGGRGRQRGQFKEPCGVVVDRDDNIYVMDKENCRIQKFTSEGNFIALAGSSGSQTLQFQSPTGIALNSKNGKLYVCDQCNHRIQILNTDLTFSGSFGSRGLRAGQFTSPVDLAFDTSGNVYIADMNNHRIQAFTLEGKFLHKFGGKGSGAGQLTYPASIAIDNRDTVYVTEYHNHRVSIFTTQGLFLKTFGSRGQDVGKFNYPLTIRIDENAFILVSDSENNRLQIF